MLRADLNRGGRVKTEGDNRFINGAVSELALCSIGLKGSKLSIRPPVLVVGKRGEENRRIGWEGASSVFRGND